MRDIALMIVFVAAIAYSFRKHHVAVLVWAWFSLMSPHRMTYGFAYNFQFAQLTAIAVFVIFLMAKDKFPYPRNRLGILLLVWYAWMCLTSLTSFNDSSAVFDYWVKVTKVFALLFITAMMLRGRNHIMALTWVIGLSLGFYGFKAGLHTAQGGTVVEGPPGSFIEVSNHLGVALVIVIPLLYFLAHEQPRRWVRLGLYGVMAWSALATFGTGSRGAFLGLLGMAMFLGLKSKHRLLTIFFGGTVLLVLVGFMPESWTERMEGISTHEDHSAQSRLYTWQMILNLAAHHPITGGGFVVTENPATWYTYAVTPWLKPYSPHSIYFQVLSEHGYVGLMIFLSIWWTAWRTCSTIIQRATTPETAWAGNLARMIQPSIIGYLVAGAFVNLAHYDLPFYILLLVVLCDLEVKRALGTNSATVAAPSTGSATERSAPGHPAARGQ